MRSLLAALALLAATAAVAAGCGATRETGAGATNPASLAPADAQAVADVDGDLDSAQWQAARELIDRFPDGGKLLDKLRELDEPAGDQIVVVGLPNGDGVALTQPDDAAKLRSLVDEHELASREIEGWTAVSDDADALDAYERALDRGTLEGNAFYEAARREFPDEALATLYARGEEGGEWAGLALTAEDDGLRLAGSIREASGSDLHPLDPALVDQIPADSIAAIAFGGGDIPDELPNMLGIDLRPFAEALAGGAVVWVRPGLLIPEVTAVLPSGETAFVDQLLQTFTGRTPEDTELDGHPAKRIRADALSITYAEVDGRLVLTTGTKLTGNGRLADDPGFREAREAAGMPDATGGFVYVDVQQAASLIGLLGGLRGGGVQELDELMRNLQQIDWVYAAYGGAGPEHELAVFAAIR